MAFWGETVKPGQKKALKLANADVLHLSQACLHDPKGGRSTLQVEVQGKTYSIAVLEQGKREHECLDLFFDSDETTFIAKGTSEIHLMGYIEPAGMGEDGESEEEHQAPPKAASPKLAKAASPKTAPASSPKLAAKAASPKVSPKATPVEDDSDDDMPEDEESEEEGREIDMDDMNSEDLQEEGAESEDDGPQLSAAVQAKLAQKSPVRAAAQSPKRKAEVAPGSPAKKPKTDDEKAGYVKKLVDFIKTNGKTNLGQLGSKVPRPQGVAKMKVILEENKETFTLVGDVVTLK